MRPSGQISGGVMLLGKLQAAAKRSTYVSAQCAELGKGLGMDGGGSGKVAWMHTYCCGYFIRELLRVT